MSSITNNAAELSSLFALLASIFLFIPLVGLTKSVRQFQDVGNLVQREGFSADTVRKLQEQIRNEEFGSSQTLWLYLAGACFALSFITLLIGWGG